MRLVNFFGALLMIGSAASGVVQAKSAPYMIPAGSYLAQDLFLEVSKVQYTLDEDGNIRELRYRLPKEIDGTNARTITLTRSLQHSPGVLTGPDAVATCVQDDSGVECTMEYIRKTVDPENPSRNIFALDLKSADRFIASRNYSTEQVALFKAGQLSLMHEAIGVVSLELKQ